MAAMSTSHTACADPLILTNDPTIQHTIITFYDPPTGAVTVRGNDQPIQTYQLESASGAFIPANVDPSFLASPFDLATESKMFALRTGGVYELNLGEVLPAQLEPSMLLADLTMYCSTFPAGNCPSGLIGGGPYLYVGPFADAIYRWDDGFPIPGTEGLNPGPGLALNHLDLQYASLSEFDLTGSSFVGSNLSHAKFVDTNLSIVDLTEANLRDANLTGSTLDGARFTNANLSFAVFGSSSLQGVDLTDAIVSGASFRAVTGLTKEQFYATANYQARSLHRIGLAQNDLTEWDLSGQDLSYAQLQLSKLSDARLENANLTGATHSSAQLWGATYNQWSVFSDDLEPSPRGLVFHPSPAGDFNADDRLDGLDLDLFADFYHGLDRRTWLLPMFDLNIDSCIDADDHRFWVKDLKHTWFGDSDLSGEFNASDLEKVLTAGEYEDDIVFNSGWSEGDWNADGEFNSGDLIVALADGGYEQGPRPPTAAIPEPSGLLLITGLLPLAWMRAKRGTTANNPAASPVSRTSRSLPTPPAAGTTSPWEGAAMAKRISICGFVFVCVGLLAAKGRADIYRWDTGQLIPGTEGITPGPGVQLDHLTLQYADLGNMNLTGASFEASELTRANLGSSTLSSANLTGAVVRGALLGDTTARGFTADQLYSTISYQTKNLGNIELLDNNLAGWDFSGQDLTGSHFARTTLTGTDFRGATIRNAVLIETTSRGFTKEQLYSTASYEAKDLVGVVLFDNNLAGWDFSGQDMRNSDITNTSLIRSDFSAANLSGAHLNSSDLTNANLSDAVIDGADLRRTRLRYAQLSSTASFQMKRTQNLLLDGNDFSGGDFGGLNLHATSLSGSVLSHASFAAADLSDASLSDAELSHASLAQSNLTNCGLSGATLTGSDLTGAEVTRASFAYTTSRGFTAPQLYSTQSYRDKNLEGIKLWGNDLTGWDFSGQNLAGARFAYEFGFPQFTTDLTDANFTGANFTGAVLGGSTLSGANLKNAYVNFVDLPWLSSPIFDSRTVYNQWTVFREDFDPVAAGLTLEVSPVGDLNADDILGSEDVNVLTLRLRTGAATPPWLPDAAFDMDGDGGIGLEDHRVWVKVLKHTWFGDANLDLEFNSTDLIQVLAAGKYEAAEFDLDGHLINPASWSEGDWNADGEFNSTDLVVALGDGGYEQGPRPPAPTAAVPEPWGDLLLALSLLALIGRRRG
jgi:uncharacterized protein YjbI with pentapeptide repeats